MSKKLYVGNLSAHTSEADLREAFGDYGTVNALRRATHPGTGRSRGFAFVEMADGADEAIRAMDGVQFDGHTLTVNEARPSEERRARGRQPLLTSAIR